MRRGEVWWIEHPTEGLHPGLVLTRDEAIDVLHHVLVIPATTTIRGIPTEVPLDEDDGMPKPCVLTLDNVASRRKSWFTRPLTKLGPEKMQAVCVALRHATGC